MHQFHMNRRPRKIDSTMQGDEFADTSNLVLTWSRKFLAPIGNWPEDDDKVRFTLSCVYMFIHICMEYAELIYQFGSLEGMVGVLCESPVFTMLLVKMVVFYKNRVICRMIDAAKEDFLEGKLRTPEEQNEYATYHAIAKKFYKLRPLLAGITGSFYYLTPIAGYIFTHASHNGTYPFELPYRTRVFYEITDVYTYALICTYQLGAYFIVFVGSVGTDGFLLALTMHVCGQLSALAASITNLSKDTEKTHHLKIRSVMERHLRLIWMEKELNGAFSNVYLGQVFVCAALICLNGFNMVKNSDSLETTTLLNAIFFEATMVTCLYGYCFVGQCLIEESRRVHDSFYECNWYELPASHSKDFIICMASSEKPFQFTAGKFCVFSMELFATVVRTAVGYISVLQTMM